MTLTIRRWLRSRPALSHLKVTVYTRAQCCCCHKVIDLLNDYQQTHQFTLETIDIDSDPALVERGFGTRMPPTSAHTTGCAAVQVSGSHLRHGSVRAIVGITPL